MLKGVDLLEIMVFAKEAFCLDGLMVLYGEETMYQLQFDPAACPSVAAGGYTLNSRLWNLAGSRRPRI